MEAFPQNALTLWVRKFISNQSFQLEETLGKKGENPRKTSWNKDDWALDEIQIERKNRQNEKW